MSKYEKLWRYIKSSEKETLIMSFDAIENVTGFPIDHSFLSYKKELTAYGYGMVKLSLKNKTVEFKKAKSKNYVIYIHGKNGSPEEAEHYKSLFCDCDVIGLNYKSNTPWEANKEFPALIENLNTDYQHITLIANSIGAYFSMSALSNIAFKKALFISPVVDMETVISNMMSLAGISEKELLEKKEIRTDFGETLSWEYLQYVKTHPISWRTSTAILYGERDILIPRTTVEKFSENFHAELTVMSNGEHWFHTDEQMKFLDDWILRLQRNKSI